jgi:hypothetical protein
MTGGYKRLCDDCAHCVVVAKAVSMAVSLYLGGREDARDLGGPLRARLRGGGSEPAAAKRRGDASPPQPLEGPPHGPLGAAAAPAGMGPGWLGPPAAVTLARGGLVVGGELLS